ncbi:MAG TPA: L,D-transpeptidase family protein [Acidimicrobiales bacterium]|nr:L,D-transpeptidase family protein [Acidimicrobiales bacterium]
MRGAARRRRFWTAGALAAVAVWLAAPALVAPELVGAVLGGRAPGAPVSEAAAACPANTGGPVEHATAVADLQSGGCPGYLVVSAHGQVSAFGAAVYHGDMAATALNAPVVGAAATPGGSGYYLLGADGGIFSFGDARFFGSTGSMRLNRPVVGMAVTPDGGGYWLVASDGGVFSFGDARFFGSTGGMQLNRPVVGVAPSADGAGYDLVASDGGVFSFGDARFYGSLGSHPPAYPVVGLGSTTDNGGYSLVDEYGHVYTFGDAVHYGDAACPVNPPSLGADPNLMADTGGGTQLLTVAGRYSGSTSATLAVWQRQPDGCWAAAPLAGQAAQPFSAEVGYNPATGADLEDHRREGDGSTPTGLYGFEPTFYGVSASVPNPAYSYHQLVCGDWWDEDPSSPQYNTFQHVACGATPPFGGDSEKLWTETVAYQHLAVVDFNPAPTSNPIGSGVFLHDDTTSGYTAGCVALPSGQLDAVLAWMNPSARPHIAIGTPAEMNNL